MPRSATLATSALALLLVASCDQLTTQAANEGDIFDAPLAGLTREELASFARGDEEFGRRFSPSEGLGPIFNNAACISCHSGDGRGNLDNALQRIGSPADDFLSALGGPQIQDKAIAGAVAELLPSGHAVSTRLPPPVFGVGLIEAIADETLVALSDPDDADGDGISGRPNWVTPASFVPENEFGGRPRVGRFGRKAQVASLLQQTVEAYHQDMGLTSDFLPEENRNPRASPAAEAADLVADPELPRSTVVAVTNYLRMLAPSRPGALTERREEGRVLFTTTRCSQCHVPVLRTGPSAIAPLANRDVELFSDLLLHDMGPGLADDRPDGSASGREWRTTPLWGLRLMRTFLDGDAFLLHDGRARSIEEAILLHGGEAQASRDAFATLSPAQRAALLDFVGSR